MDCWCIAAAPAYACVATLGEGEKKRKKTNWHTPLSPEAPLDSIPHNAAPPGLGHSYAPSARSERLRTRLRFIGKSLRHVHNGIFGFQFK